MAKVHDIGIIPGPARGAHPLRLVGIVCLGWTGAVTFLVGLFALGTEVYTWFNHAAWSHFPLVSVFEFASRLLGLPAAAHRDGLYRVIVEVSRVIPLSPFLMAIGWCIYQVAEAGWALAQESERAP